MKEYMPDWLFSNICMLLWVMMMMMMMRERRQYDDDDNGSGENYLGPATISFRKRTE
jgi:hypothetical protein